jgi:hypothetical protein
MLIGVVLTMTSSLAIPVALDSVSAPAGGSPLVSLADVVSGTQGFFGTVTIPGGCAGGDGVQDFDATYPGSSNVGGVALHIVGCFGNSSISSSGLGLNNGLFTITTNVGTLNGTAAGPETFPSASHTSLFVRLALSVQGGTGSFAGTTGSLQLEANTGIPLGESTGFSGTVSLAPTIARPATGASLSGSTILDASAPNATSVQFDLLGGFLGSSYEVLCTAAVTLYGWVCSWNSANVPNGSYVLEAEAFTPTSNALGPNVNVTVDNPPPSAIVARPTNGASVSGSTILDASASNTTNVEFRLFGGIYGYSAPVLCTATLTSYGWVCSWNSATVPNGSYVLLAEASSLVSTAFSPNVNITVKNPTGQHRKTTA